MVIIEHGRRKRLTKVEAIARQLANKGVAGDLRAISLMTGWNRGEAPSERETNETAPVAEADQDEPVDFVHGNKFPAVKGKPRSDERTLYDLMQEIYGLGKYAPEPPDRSPSSRRPDGSVSATDDDIIEQDRGHDLVHIDEVSGRR